MDVRKQVKLKLLATHVNGVAIAVVLTIISLRLPPVKLVLKF
jgi:hypothetical protein